MRANGSLHQICLHPVKIPTVLRGSTTLQNSQNNQVLFLDFAGHLMTASADGRAIDCVGALFLILYLDFELIRAADDALKLAIPHPIYPFPSRASHPLPQFSLDPETSTLHVLFACDPSYPVSLLHANPRIKLTSANFRVRTPRARAGWKPSISSSRSR